MRRRQILTAVTGSALFDLQAAPTGSQNTFLEIRNWRLHNSEEQQGARVTEFLSSGFKPGLERSGAKLVGAFTSYIGPDGPNFITIAEFSSWNAMGEAMSALRADQAYSREVQKLGSGSGLPFMRVESSVLRCFDAMPKVVLNAKSESTTPQVFELRTYESQSFATLPRKVDMFNHGEMQIFQRLGMRPVFFGETIIGPKQPNLMYMLSYDDLAARERLWREFSADAEWKKLSSRPEMKDPQIVSNISNVILRPLPFSLLR